MLKDVAALASDISPEVVYEKQGLWPIIKLVILDIGLGFYLPIMNKQREARAWPELHFVDAMAGNGITRATGERSGGHLVAGSALIGANCEKKFPGKSFDFYHFVEPHKPWAKVLEARLARLLPSGKFRVYDQPPSEAIAAIAAAMRGRPKGSNPHYFALVDPEGLTEVTLPQLKPLFDLGRGDFLFNFQFMGMKRAPESATKFLGDARWPEAGTEEEIRAFFWSKLGQYGRPVGAAFTVAAGEGHGRYAYEMYYTAARTEGNNAWLDTFRETINRRASGMDGTNLDRLLGTRSLDDFF